MSGRHTPPLRTWRRAPGSIGDGVLLVTTIVAGSAAVGMLFLGALVLIPR